MSIPLIVSGHMIKLGTGKLYDAVDRLNMTSTEDDPLKAVILHLFISQYLVPKKAKTAEVAE